MNRLPVGVIVALALSLLASTTCICGSYAPQKREVTIERMVVAPTSYERMFDDSDVVVRVKILNSHPMVVDRPGGLPGAVTEYTAQIAAVVKGSYKRADVIRFVQQAGRVETADTIITVVGAQPLNAGGEYVVFLRPYPYLCTLIITNDPEGAYEIHDGKIRPAGASQVSNARRDMPAHEFLSELDRVAQRRGLVR